MLTRGRLAISLVVIVFVIACSQVHSANAQLHPNTSYIIYEKNHDIKNASYTLDLQIQTGSDNSNKIPVSLVEGLLVHDGKYFVATHDWKGVIMKNDNLMMLSGDAVGVNGSKISVTILGRQINDTQNGAFYRLAGNIKYDNYRSGFVTVSEIENVQLLTSEKISKEMPHLVINQNPALKKLVTIPKKANDITVITKHHDRFYLQYPYSFTSKVYYLKDNPRDNFDQRGGEVEGARITADIINQEGEVVKSFEGMTGKFGYFSDSFLPPDNFAIGTYSVVVTAEKNGQTDIDELVFHIFKRSVGGKPVSAGAPETSPPETSPPETSPPETSPPETSPPETSPPETSPPETSPPETSPPETSPPETSPPETTPEPTPETTPEPTPETTPEPTPETIPLKVSISSPVDGSILQSPSFAISGTATGTDLAAVMVTVDGTTKYATGVDSWSINSGALPDGIHKVTATVIDGIGKTSSSIVHVVTDITEPTGEIMSLSHGELVHLPALKISGTAFDATSGIKKVEVKIDSNAFQVANGTTAWTFDTASLSDGTHTVKIRVTDNAGNVFVGLGLTFTVRTSPTGLTAIPLDENRIALAWTSPILETGYITGYKIERESPIGGGWHTIVSDTGNILTAYTDTGLTAGTVYHYRVSAIYGGNTGAPSHSASATTHVITLALK